MIRQFKLKDAFAMGVGILLLIEGIWGMFSDITFGVLTTNRLHASIHIVLGLTGMLLGWKRNARVYCLFLSILLIGVGLLRFINEADAFIIKLLNVNIPVALFNFVVGILSFLVSISLRNKDLDNMVDKKIQEE